MAPLKVHEHMRDQMHFGTCELDEIRYGAVKCGRQCLPDTHTRLQALVIMVNKPIADFSHELLLAMAHRCPKFL